MQVQVEQQQQLAETALTCQGHGYGCSAMWEELPRPLERLHVAVVVMSVTPHHWALRHSQRRTCGEEVAWFVLHNRDLVANT